MFFDIFNTNKDSSGHNAKRKNYGQLSNVDIKNELKKEGGMSIITCMDINKNIHAASVDITPTIVCMSAKSGMLQTVYDKRTQSANSYYIYVKPHDTILIISNELITLPNYISGYVTSRVSNIVNGFGHICTTIDPNWQGALLIGLNNPTNRTIKIDVGTTTRFSTDKNMAYPTDKKPLATLTFHYLSTETKEHTSKYSSMRTDLLKQICYKDRHGVKSFIRKVFHPKQRKFTDYFFEYLHFHENEMKTRSGWMQFLNEFSVFNSSQRSQSGNSTHCKRAFDFVVKENIFNRTKHLFDNHKTAVTVVIAIIFLVIYKSCLKDSEILNAIYEILQFMRG